MNNGYFTREKKYETKQTRNASEFLLKVQK